jgi:ketosteroid isomerase-like protein
MTSAQSTLATDPKIAAVDRLYAAYGQGNIDGVLAELTDDVDWAAEAASRALPWYGEFRGKAAVPGFFAAIHDNLDVSEFTIVGHTSNERDVVTTVHWTYTVKRTGKSASMYMQHWFRFDGAKIAFFRGSEDSAQSIAAFAQ